MSLFFFNICIKASNNDLVNGHLKSFNDRLGEQIAKCDQEIRKMFADCQHLIDEEHYEADVYYKKFDFFFNFFQNYKKNFFLIKG